MLQCTHEDWLPEFSMGCSSWFFRCTRLLGCVYIVYHFFRMEILGSEISGGKVCELDSPQESHDVLLRADISHSIPRSI